MPASTNSSTDNKSSIPEPEWNSSALTMRIWFNDLTRWLPHQDRAYRSLIERGYFINRDKTIVSSIPQAIDLTEGLLPTFTFQDPAPHVYTQTPAARQAAIQRTNDELARLAKEKGEKTPPSPVNSPRFPSKLPDSLAITVAPSVVSAKRHELCDTILSTVPDNDKADALRAISNGDGCTLLRHIYTESSKVSVKYTPAFMV